MKRRIMTIAVIAAGALVWMGLGPPTGNDGDKHESPLGLKLVAKYEPLHLYIYADTASTNKHPDFLICEGNDDVVYRENTESNTMETTHFENGYAVLMTRRDKDGKVLRRMASYHDDSGKMQYTYIDRNGDGLWDVFSDDTRGRYYVRSNLCWVLRFQDTNQPQGVNTGTAKIPAPDPLK